VWLWRHVVLVRDVALRAVGLSLWRGHGASARGQLWRRSALPVRLGAGRCAAEHYAPAGAGEGAPVRGLGAVGGGQRMAAQ
jgi:hypothetical protein